MFHDLEKPQLGWLDLEGLRLLPFELFANMCHALLTQVLLMGLHSLVSPKRVSAPSKRVLAFRNVSPFQNMLCFCF